MDSKGTIYPGPVADAIRKEAEAGDPEMKAIAKELEPLTDLEAAELRGMNRAQRRAWYSNRRRSKPRFGGAR